MDNKSSKIVKPKMDASSSKRQQVEEMFDNIAPNYDLLNKVLSAGIDRKWRKKAIGYISPKTIESALDIATGTADLALEIHKQTNCDNIIGLDISNEMLEVGRQKISKKELNSSIKLEQGDSTELRFEDASFDVVTAAFGVRNFEDLNKGLSEMKRVLKDDGQLIILEFTKPRSFPFKQLFNTYFKYILPVIGKLKSRDDRAYQYLYESVQVFPDYDAFVENLENLGFKNCKWEALTFGICAVYTARK